MTGETRSRIGIAIFYNGMPICWKSTLTSSTQLSSGQAELYGLSELLKWALHISYIARDLQIDDRSCLRLETDSAAAKGFCSAEGATGKMKHIDIRKNWVTELRDRKKCYIAKIPGAENPADFLTKVFTAAEFKRLEEYFVHHD